MSLWNLPIPPDICSCLQIDSPYFAYGKDTEYYANGVHRVPSTTGIWTAGNKLSPEIVITNAAMEALAYVTIYRHTLPTPSELFFIALGNRPHPAQLEHVRNLCKKRKVTLVFGDDLPGKLFDVRVATSIRNKYVSIRYAENQIYMGYKGKRFDFDPDTLTLAKVERRLGIRTGVRTRKPLRHDSYLEELKSIRPSI